MTRLTTFDLPTFQRATVGFSNLFDELERQFSNEARSAYPPYNVIELSENQWMISIAVAGFSMEELDISLEKNMLTIEGNPSKSNEDTAKYLYKGIAGRSFRRQFTIADHVDVVDATLTLGMLNIRLERKIPDDLQPKRIAITTDSGQ